jgi:hypothetical protein
MTEKEPTAKPAVSESDESEPSSKLESPLDIVLAHIGDVVAFNAKIEWEGTEYYYKSYHRVLASYICYERAVREANEIVLEHGRGVSCGDVDEGEEIMLNYVHAVYSGCDNTCSHESISSSSSGAESSSESVEEKEEVKEEEVSQISEEDSQTTDEDRKRIHEVNYFPPCDLDTEKFGLAKSVKFMESFVKRRKVETK